MNVQKVLLCPFQCEPRPSGVTLESAELKNIPQVPGNRAEVGQNHDARKPGSATLLVLKQSGAISRPRSSKMSLQKALMFPVYCRPRTSGATLQSPGMENIPQVPGNLAKLGQNHDARTAVSATLSVLK